MFLCEKEDKVFMIQIDLHNQETRRQATEQLLRLTEESGATFGEVFALSPTAKPSSADSSTLTASEGSLSSRTGTASPYVGADRASCSPRTASQEGTDGSERGHEGASTPASDSPSLSPSLLSILRDSAASAAASPRMARAIRMPRVHGAADSLLSSLSHGTAAPLTLEDLLAEGVSILELSGGRLTASSVSFSVDGEAECVVDGMPSTIALGGEDGGDDLLAEDEEGSPIPRPPGYPSTPKANVRPATAISLMRLQQGPESMMTFPRSRPASAAMASGAGVVAATASIAPRCPPSGTRRHRSPPRDAAAPPVRLRAKGGSQGTLVPRAREAGSRGTNTSSSSGSLHGAREGGPVPETPSKLLPKRGPATLRTRAGAARLVPRSILVASCTSSSSGSIAGPSGADQAIAHPPPDAPGHRNIQLSYDEGVAGSSSSWNAQLDPPTPAAAAAAAARPRSIPQLVPLCPRTRPCSKPGSRGSSNPALLPHRPVRMPSRPPTPPTAATAAPPTTTTTTPIPYACALCHKKLRLATCFKCRCNASFCAVHRYSDRHACPHDYRQGGRARLRQENPPVAPDKVARL